MIYRPIINAELTILLHQCLVLILPAPFLSEFNNQLEKETSAEKSFLTLILNCMQRYLHHYYATHSMHQKVCSTYILFVSYDEQICTR